MKEDIEKLQDILDICPLDWQERKALERAIEISKKHIYKRPIDTDKGWACPDCKRHIWHEQQTMHCKGCGQLVYWG